MSSPTAPPPQTDPQSDQHSVTRRNFLIGGTAAGLGFATYAGTHARHELDITHHTLSIKNLPEAFQNFKIIQISDIHLEEYTEPWFLEHAVQRINALTPDLVLLTGDFISRGPRSKAFAIRTSGLAAEILSGLKAPQRYAVLGNHDAVVGPTPIIARLEAHGTPVLVDTHIPIERGADRIWLAGAKDPGVLGCDLNLAIPAKPDAPVLFMAHEPDFADRVIQHPRYRNIDVMLSGHTHGGQVRLPFVGPLVLPPMGKKYIEGLFHLGHMQLFVNRGLGTVGLPFRLNCPPEISQLTLIRA
jgi:predicted MPP superfamily phosphohydrolase